MVIGALRHSTCCAVIVLLSACFESSTGGQSAPPAAKGGRDAAMPLDAGPMRESGRDRAGDAGDAQSDARPFAPDAEPPTPCGEQIPSELPAEASGSDTRFHFTAPGDGLYVFESFVEQYVGAAEMPRGTFRQGPACDGPVLMPELPDGLPYLYLEAGQTVVVEYEPHEGDRWYSVTVDRVIAPPGCDEPEPLDGEELPYWAEHHMPLASDDASLACQPSAGREAVHYFTAPHDGRYVFDATLSDFPVTLAVLDGSGCAGATLACEAERVRVELTSGQTVSIVVQADAAASGRYRLGVDGERHSCQVLEPYSSALEGPSLQFAWDDADWPGNTGREAVVSFVAPQEGRYCFEAHYWPRDDWDDEYSASLLLLDGDSCEAPILARPVTLRSGQPQISLVLSEGQQVLSIIGIDRNSYTEPPGFRITSCRDCLQVPFSLPYSVTIPDQDWNTGWEASCWGQAEYSPCRGGDTEKYTIVGFVAPEDGSYTFDTLGSSVDTVLTLVRGSDELCNDDAEEGVAQSSLTVDLDQWQELRIQIDIDFGVATGVLNVRRNGPRDGTQDPFTERP